MVASGLVCSHYSRAAVWVMWSFTALWLVEVKQPQLVCKTVWSLFQPVEPDDHTLHSPTTRHAGKNTKILCVSWLKWENRFGRLFKDALCVFLCLHTSLSLSLSVSLSHSTFTSGPDPALKLKLQSADRKWPSPWRQRARSDVRANDLTADQLW